MVSARGRIHPPPTYGRRLAAGLLALALAACSGRNDRGLPAPQVVAPGVRLYHLADSALIEPPVPVAIRILRLDPTRVTLQSALANDEVMGRETVTGIAARHGALAAINAGFFLPNGDPSGLLQIDGLLVSDTSRPRGAVAITNTREGRTRLDFDVVTATARLGVPQNGDTRWIPIGGIDTTRVRGRLMLFTPRYHDDTDTAGRGIEWVLAGEPLTVTDKRVDAGSTPIPGNGFVLSYGGLDPPPPLQALTPGVRVVVERRFVTRYGSAPEIWDRADHVIGGAGLLVRDGRPVGDWSVEDLRKGFETERHPRTVIGRDTAGEIWLIAVDGRNPQVSLGMTFADLQRLATRLELTDALNLDGGGSTTMVVRGEIVNSPSDAAGPREVSDALLVVPR